MWLRPPATGIGRRITHGLIRLFALTMSGTLVIASIGVFVDLVGWQCAAPTASCARQRPWLRFFFNGFFEPTGRRLALAALGPILVVVGLWFLAVRSWAKYESYELPERNADGDGLATPTFWDGRDQVGRLRSVHVAAMFAVIDAMLLFVLVRHDLDTDAYYQVDLRGVDPDLVVRLGTGLAGLVAAIILLCIVLLLLPPIVERVSKSRVAAVVARLLRWLSVLATAATLGYALVPRAPWPTSGSLPGFAGTVTKLFTVQVVLLALLTLACLTMRHRCKGAMLAGFGSPVVASLALGLGAALSAGVEFRVAWFLGGNQLTSATDVAPIDQLPLQPPAQYQWAAVGFVLLVLLAIVSVLWVRLVTAPGLRRKARRQTDEDFPGGRARDAARAAQLDDAIADASLTDRLSRVLGFAWIVVAAGGVVATAFAVRDKGPSDLAGSNQTVRDTVSIVANIGTYLIGLTALGLVLLGIQTYRNARVRRTVGIIWDLATFWPRAASPLGPPCYAERVVPELVHRATWLANDQGGVVLSGHSQGSVLVAATVLQMPLPARRRTALITYGAPICRLYMRAFPHYFNEKVLNDIAATVAGPRGEERWVNLWRRTDPIGGEVGIGDRRLADPVAFDPLPGDRIAPAVKAHGGYQLTPQFGQAMDDLVGLLREH